MNSGSSTDRLAPKQLRSTRSRQLLLAAARDLIEEVGIERVTLAAVAARSGMAVGTVYTRFRDRSHLLEEVVSAWTVEVTEKFVDPLLGTDPRQRLRALVRLFREHQSLVQQLLVHAQLQPEIAAHVRPWLAGEEARLVAALRSEVHTSATSAELAARMVLATVERATLDRADDPTWDRLEVDLPEAGLLLLQADLVRRRPPSTTRNDAS